MKPTSAAGRIDRWQKKLLDLTLHNKLLNFPDSKKTIPFLCTDVAYLEDRLADGAAIRIVSLPEQNPASEMRRSTAMFTAAIFSAGSLLKPCFGTNCLPARRAPARSPVDRSLSAGP